MARTLARRGRWLACWLAGSLARSLGNPTFGSNSREERFSKLRGFTSAKSSLCLMDMIDLRVRFQKLEELKMQGKKITVSTLQWAKKIDEDIIFGLVCRLVKK